MLTGMSWDPVHLPAVTINLSHPTSAAVPLESAVQQWCSQVHNLCAEACVFADPCSNNAIDLEGTKALASALAVNTSLKSLILSDNYIGETPGWHRHSTHVVAANNQGHIIHAVGAGQLMTRGTTLHLLIVCCSERQLLSSTPGHKAKQHNLLTLHHTPPAGVEGAKALSEALLTNNSIIELTIRGNDLGDEGIEALAAALMVSGRAVCCVAEGSQAPCSQQHVIFSL